MNIAALVVLFAGAVVCGECVFRTLAVWQLDTKERWVVPVMAVCTAGQFAIFGWLFWMTLQ